MKFKAVIATVLLAVGLQANAEEFWPIWIKFPVERQIETDDGWVLSGYGTIHFSVNGRAIWFEGFRDRRSISDTDGAPYLEFAHQVFDMTRIDIDEEEGPFNYLFAAVTRDRWQDQVAGAIRFDTVPILGGSGYAGSVSRFLMMVLVPPTSTGVRYVAPPSEFVQRQIDSYPQVDWGTNHTFFDTQK